MIKFIWSARRFLKKSFQANPAYSFNDWRIMYRHSCRVKKLADKICSAVGGDRQVVLLGALLHDIGKTYRASEEVLRERHNELGWEVSRDFIMGLNFKEEQKNKLRDILTGCDGSLESQIIHEADIVAFFIDKKLQTALKIWADKNNLPNELKRKLDNWEKLKFEISKKIAKKYYSQMKIRWGL